MAACEISGVDTSQLWLHLPVYSISLLLNILSSSRQMCVSGKQWHVPDSRRMSTTCETLRLCSGTIMCTDQLVAGAGEMALDVLKDHFAQLIIGPQRTTLHAFLLPFPSPQAPGSAVAEQSPQVLGRGHLSPDSYD